MTVAKRVVEFCKSKDLRQADLFTLSLASRQTISFIWNGEHKPNCDFLEKLTKQFEDLNVRWLLTGEGEMLIPNLVQSNEILLEYLKEQLKEQKEENKRLNREIGALMKK